MVYFGDEVFVLSVRIHAVTAGSPAEKAGILPDDRHRLHQRGTRLTDEIDYQAFPPLPALNVVIEHEVLLAGIDPESRMGTAGPLPG